VEAQWRLSGDIVEARTRRVYFLTTRVKQRKRKRGGKGNMYELSNSKLRKRRKIKRRSLG